MITVINGVTLNNDNSSPSSQITESDLIAIQAISGKSPMLKEDYDKNNNLRVDVKNVSIKLTLSPVTTSQAQLDFDSVYIGGQ